MSKKYSSSEIFSRFLNLNPDWQITAIEPDDEECELNIYVDYVSKTAKCPKSGETCSIYDRRPERKWRHLDTCQYKTFIRCRPPRVKNSKGEVSVIEVPWAAACSRITFFLSDL